MKKSKIFLLVAIIFLAVVIVVMIDMASKTTFPGQNKESHDSTALSPDTTTGH